MGCKKSTTETRQYLDPQGSIIEGAQRKVTEFEEVDEDLCCQAGCDRIESHMEFTNLLMACSVEEEVHPMHPMQYEIHDNHCVETQQLDFMYMLSSGEKICSYTKNATKSSKRKEIDHYQCCSVARDSFRADADEWC